VSAASVFSPAIFALGEWRGYTMNARLLNETLRKMQSETRLNNSQQSFDYA
jgi:hypothetical protein